MAWNWIEKGAKRLQELGGDYKQHHALIERLLTIDTAAAQEELTRAALAMDDRDRAGVKLTLAGLVLSQQADVLYKASDYHVPQDECALAWNDARIGIDWPLPAAGEPRLSTRDQAAPGWHRARLYPW